LYKSGVARYAIGDLQGCMDSLERLLGCLPLQPGDSLWLVGDLVNRGPKSLEVLRWAKAHQGQVRCVLGNHDLHLLARAAGAPAKRRDTLDAVLAAPDRVELIEWLRHQPLLYLEDQWLLVHAGLHPQWTAAVAAQLAAEVEGELRSPRWREVVSHLETSAMDWRVELTGSARWRAILSYLVRARTCYSDGRLEPQFDGPPAQAPPGCIPWFQLANAQWRSHVPVFGHWAALGLEVEAGHVALDSGCVWGRSLSAIRLEDRTVFQVKAVDVAG
jgi:bis(5'-nucleosyl)-tetraphosphatase (symmetrical)